MDKIGFGGGCHWCSEAVFQALRGVCQVEQGYIRSAPPADNWSEAVIVSFDPAIITLATLVEVHIRTHAASKAHSMRNKYRSAVYIFKKKQAKIVQQQMNKIEPDFESPLVTRILPFIAFKPSDGRYHNYYKANPDRPFCKRYIDPKLDHIRRIFGNQLSA